MNYLMIIILYKKSGIKLRGTLFPLFYFNIKLIIMNITVTTEQKIEDKKLILSIFTDVIKNNNNSFGILPVAGDFICDEDGLVAEIEMRVLCDYSIVFHLKNIG